MQTTIIGTVQNGKFVPTSKEYFKRAFESYEGKEIELTLKVWHKKRSNNQNAYYWGVVIQLIANAINELGNDYDTETVHEYLRGLFLKSTKELIDNVSGEITNIEFIKSTTKLSALEFETYLEKCKAFAAEKFDLYIPDPNENE